jgi:hypothetical protein
MSYYTRVEFQMSDEVSAEVVLSHARSYLEAQGTYSVEDVLANLKTALCEGNCLFKGMTCDEFEGLLESVSAALPSATFFVRGMGEEFPDVWLRRFTRGKSSSSIGPFNLDERLPSAR